MGLRPVPPNSESTDALLRVYLLGSVEFDAVLALQRLLIYQTAGERHKASLIVCEHPSLITVGREGSRAHIHYESEELQHRGWPVRWVNRGGGCVLHLPGQFAFNPVLALDRLGLTPTSYLEQLGGVVCDLLDDFSVKGHYRREPSGVWVGDRPIAALGTAVRHWVAYFGGVLNVHTDLEALRPVRYGASDAPPMTSLERERRGPLRPSLVRERLVEHFAARFGFDRTALFFDHPALSRPRPEAVAASS